MLHGTVLPASVGPSVSAAVRWGAMGLLGGCKSRFLCAFALPLLRRAEKLYCATLVAH